MFLHLIFLNALLLPFPNGESQVDQLQKDSFWKSNKNTLFSETAILARKWSNIGVQKKYIAVGVNDMCYVTHDMRHVKPDTRNLKPDTWHLAPDDKIRMKKYNSIGASIRTRREIQCLLFAGFFKRAYLASLSSLHGMCQVSSWKVTIL